MSVDKHLRMAREEDLSDIVRFCKNFHSSSPYRVMRFDSGKTRDFILGIINGSKLDQVCLVALDEGKPVGFLVGASSEPVFSRNRIAMEMAWWVEKEHRGCRGSLLMYSAYEDWAARIGCSHVQGAYLPGVSPDLDKFYKKRGYVQTESSYVKVLKV